MYNNIIALARTIVYIAIIYNIEYEYLILMVCGQRLGDDDDDDRRQTVRRTRETSLVESCT